MFSLEDGREHHQCLYFAFAIHDHYGEFVVFISSLARSRDHTAAIESSMHCRGKPYFFICVLNSIYSNGCFGRLIVEEKAFDGYGCIVDRLFTFSSERITNFTAVSIYTISNTINESILLSLYFHNRQVLNVLIDRKWLFFIYVPGKVISASNRIIIYSTWIG